VKSILTIDNCSILNLKYINRFYLLKALGYSTITTIYVQIEFEKAKQKYPDSFIYFRNLIDSGEIVKFPLDIEDLIEMSNVPQSKRASDAELSCFVVAKRIGSKVMTDDKKARNYIQRYIQMSPSNVIQLVEILIEAYLENHLGDHELSAIQATLAAHKFVIKINLASEAARRRLIMKAQS
jgi:predicted nucleic acid-binding protein